MKEDILSVIGERMPKFSKGQRRIAAYITENCDKAAFMTANRLGQTADVSESTVVRFAMELGFDGYPNFQKAMQEAMLHRLTSPQPTDVDRDHITNVLHTDAELLRCTANTLDRDAFSTAVDAILRANSIYVMGVRSSVALADFAAFYLKYLFPNVHIITNSGSEEMIGQLMNIGKDDMVLVFDFPPYSSAVIKGIRYCQSAGTAVVAITNSYSSPAGKCCDNVLVAQSDGASFAESLVAPLGIVNALLAALATKREEVLTKNLNILERFRETDTTNEKGEDWK